MSQLFSGKDNLSQKHKNLQGGVPCNSGVSRNCSELCPGRAATVNKNLQGGVPCNSGVSRNCSELCPGRAATVNGPEGSSARPFPRPQHLHLCPNQPYLKSSVPHSTESNR